MPFRGVDLTAIASADEMSHHAPADDYDDPSEQPTSFFLELQFVGTVGALVQNAAAAGRCSFARGCNVLTASEATFAAECFASDMAIDETAERIVAERRAKAVAA